MAPRKQNKDAKGKGGLRGVKGKGKKPDRKASIKGLKGTVKNKGTSGSGRVIKKAKQGGKKKVAVAESKASTSKSSKNVGRTGKQATLELKKTRTTKKETDVKKSVRGKVTDSKKKVQNAKKRSAAGSCTDKEGKTKETVCAKRKGRACAKNNKSSRMGRNGVDGTQKDGVGRAKSLKRKQTTGDEETTNKRVKKVPELEVKLVPVILGPLAPIERLSLEVLCKIIGFLDLKDALKLQSLSRTLKEAVGLHLRICKNIDFTEGEVCGFMSDKIGDRVFGRLITRCPDLENIHGLHPKSVCKAHCKVHSRMVDCFTIKGIVAVLKNCQKLKGIETSHILLLEAILHKLPHLKIIGLFKNRHGSFPAIPSQSFCLKHNPPITKLHLTGVILPELPRMEYVIYLALKWVKFTNLNPFREFMAPRLHTFVMNNCSGPTNALKYVPLVTRLAAASNLTRLELVRVPFLGAFFQHVVEDTWRLGGFRQLKKILISACKHATEIDMGHLLLTAAESICEVYIQPSLTKDSLFLALSMAEPDFPKIDTISLGYVDPFPVEKGKWEPLQVQLALAGLADAGSSEHAALITDVGIQHVGKDFTFVRNLNAYNCPHLINPRDWLTPDGMCFAQLRSLHLNRCHAIKLQPFCDMLAELPSIETVYLERMFREPPKGCSRVGLSAGTGLGVSQAFLANQDPEPAAAAPAAPPAAPAGVPNVVPGPAVPNEADALPDPIQDTPRSNGDKKGESTSPKAGTSKKKASPKTGTSEKKSRSLKKCFDGISMNEPDIEPESLGSETDARSGKFSEKSAHAEDKVPVENHGKAVKSTDKLGNGADSAGSKSCGEKILESRDEKSNSVRTCDSEIEQIEAKVGSEVEGVKIGEEAMDVDIKDTGKSDNKDVEEEDDGTVEIVSDGRGNSLRGKEEDFTVTQNEEDSCVEVHGEFGLLVLKKPWAKVSHEKKPKDTEAGEDVAQVDETEKACPVHKDADAKATDNDGAPLDRAGANGYEGKGKRPVGQKAYFKKRAKSSLGVGPSDESGASAESDESGVETGARREEDQDSVGLNEREAENLDSGENVNSKIPGEIDCETRGLNSESQAALDYVPTEIKNGMVVQGDKEYIVNSDDGLRPPAPNECPPVEGDGPSSYLGHVCLDDSRTKADGDGPSAYVKIGSPVRGDDDSLLNGEQVPIGENIQTSRHNCDSGLTRESVVREETGHGRKSDAEESTSKIELVSVRKYLPKGLADTNSSEVESRKDSNGPNISGADGHKSPAALPKSCASSNPVENKRTKDSNGPKKGPSAEEHRCPVASKAVNKQDTGDNKLKGKSPNSSSKLGHGSSGSGSKESDETISLPAEARKTVATQTTYDDAGDLNPDAGPSGDYVAHSPPSPPSHGSPDDQAAAEPGPRRRGSNIPVFRCFSDVDDDELEDDVPQVLNIKSRTLVSLTIHMVGVTDLVITDSPQIKVVHGTSCRVLKTVNFNNTPKLTRVNFAQCNKLDHMSIIRDVTKLPPTSDRFVFLRPMAKFSARSIGEQLFDVSNGYHGCFIQDHSLEPSKGQIRKARFIEKIKLVSSISFHILRLNKYPIFKKTPLSEPPWGRNLHDMTGKTPDGSPWEAVTDIPWLPHLESLQTKEEDRDAVDIIEEKVGLQFYSMEHIWPFGCFEGIAEAIGHAEAAESALYPRTIGIYVNTCDVSGIPTPDEYV